MRTKLLLFFLIALAFSVPAWAQGGNGQSNYPIGGIYMAGAPVGNCPAQNIVYINSSNGALYTCPVQGGPWVLSGGGTGSLVEVDTGYGLTGGPCTTTCTIALLVTLPNGEQAVTQLVGDMSNDVATDAFVYSVLASSGLLPQSGCQVESIAGTLMVTVGACLNYTINGAQYSSPLTTVTLATADPTNPRLDLIGVNTSGAVFVTTGTPAPNPVEPSVDPSTQFGLTAVLVPAGASSPSLTVVDIYHDCLEWTLTSSGAPITTCSAANPYNAANPKSINGASATTGNYVQLTDPASGTVTLPSYNNLVFYIDAPVAWPSTRSLTVQWYNGSTAVGSPVLVGSSGTFAFTSGVSGYQQIAIPTTLFNTSTAVGSVRITVSGTGGTINFDIADVTLQGGASSGGGGVFMTNRGAWNTTAAYNVQNVVTYLGASWIALAANTNSAPSATNANWQLMTNPGANQQVIYNSNGLLVGNSCMTYNPSTQAFTVCGSVNVSGSGPSFFEALEGSAPTGVVGSDIIYADLSLHCFRLILNNGTVTGCLGTSSGSVTSITVAGTANQITASGTCTITTTGTCTLSLPNPLLVGGVIDGEAPLTITTVSSCTLGTASGCNATKFQSGYTFNQEATAAQAITYTLPTAAAGLQYCVANSYNGSAANTGTLELLTSASGQFIIFTDGTLSASGGYVQSGGAAGDWGCVVGLDSTHWQFTVVNGTWTKH